LSQQDVLALLRLGLCSDELRRVIYGWFSADDIKPHHLAEFGFLLGEAHYIDAVNPITAPAATIPHVFAFFASGTTDRIPDDWLIRARRVADTLTPHQAQQALWSLLSLSGDGTLVQRLNTISAGAPWLDPVMKQQYSYALNRELTPPLPIRIPARETGKRANAMNFLEKLHGHIERDVRDGHYIFDARTPDGSLVLVDTGNKHFPIYTRYIPQRFIRFPIP
jgi:hypothetical protein